jgi:hypothetical protein
MRRVFSRQGLGYVMSLPDIAGEISVASVHRERGDLRGEIAISCGLPGTRSHDGQLHAGRMNLSSVTNRQATAKYVAERAGDLGVDWRDLLEDFCARVLRAERERRPVVRVGDRPQRIAPRFQVEPIIPFHRVTTLFGAPGSGKSTLAVALGVSVQTGIVVVPGWRPTPTNVLYLDWETDEDDIDEKVKAIAAGAGIEDTVTFAYLACHGRSLADQLEYVVGAVQENAAGFVIVDSTIHAAGTSSSEGADAAETTLRLYTSFALLQATVVVIDHITKASAQDPSRPATPYGSVFKEAMARQAFEVRRADGAGDRSSIALYNTKASLDRRSAPIGLSVEQTTSRIVYRREDVTGDLLKPLSIASQVEAVLRSGALHYNEIAEIVELDDHKVRAVLSRHKGTRFVQLGEGKWGLVRHAG